MKYKNILVYPDLTVEERFGDKPYLFPEFSKGKRIQAKERIDKQLPCGAFLHTSNRKDGTFILISKKLE